MKRPSVVNAVLAFIIAVVGAYYWNWCTLHNPVVISQPTAVSQPTVVKSEEDLEKHQPDVAKDNARVNILVLGTDNMGNEVARTDSMIFVSATLNTHKISVISIPRDTRVNIPGVGLTKITHANVVGELKGGIHEGTLQSAKAVSDLLGVTVNYYVKINFKGFVKTVDAIGGIDVTLPNEVNDNSSNLHLSAGSHHLSGNEALILAQARYGLPKGDFDRQQDQFYILSALAQQMLNPANISKLPEVLKVAHQELVDTNLSVVEMATMGLEFKGVNEEAIKYYQLPGDGISAHDPLVNANVYYYEPNLEGVKAVVQEATAWN